MTWVLAGTLRGRRLDRRQQRRHRRRRRHDTERHGHGPRGDGHHRRLPGSGNAPGILTAQSVGLYTGSTFVVTLGHTSAGTPVAGVNYDQLDVNGNVDLDADDGGGATLEVNADPSSQVGDTFVIIQAQGGTVSGTFADLPQGATLTVGDALFRIGYGTDDVVLTEVETPTIDANADLYLSELGQTLTLDATVSGTAGTPTGTVTFYDGDPSDGGQPLGSPVSIDASGQAGLSTSSLAIGEHTIYAVYSGDSNNLPGTAALARQLVVSDDFTTTTLASAQPSTTYDAAAVFTATVGAAFGGTPSGTVAFYDGGTLIGTAPLDASGIATLSIGTLAVTATPHGITANYSGDSNFDGSGTASRTRPSPQPR